MSFAYHVLTLFDYYNAMLDFRSNPDSLRMMLQMSSMMGQSGVGGFPAPGNPSGGFPAPGLPGNATNPSSPASGSPPAQALPSLLSLFGGAGAGTASGTAPDGAGAASPFGSFDPALMQQLFSGGGGGLGGGAGIPFGPGGFGGFGGGNAAPVTPQDPRPPEERFQVQLQVGSSSNQHSGFG
jgi:ubiquilin